MLLELLHCYGNQEIQKIAVFEGVFEKLFNIIVEEGGSEGGIVVQVGYLIWFVFLQGETRCCIGHFGFLKD